MPAGTSGNPLVNYLNGTVVSAINANGEFFSQPTDTSTVPFVGNAPSGTTASLIDLLVNNVHKFTVTSNGALLVGSLTSSVTGSPAVALTNVTGTLPTASTAALTGDVTKSAGTNATVAVGSTNLQQPISFVGSSAVVSVSAAATTGTINTPTGTANGDLETVTIALNNTTSSAFTPPAGWAAIASCNSSGNTNQIQVFSHTASSEGATIAAFTWTTNGTGIAYASAYRNAAIDVCAASTGASAGTFSATGLTASSTGNRVVAVGIPTNNSSTIKPTTVPTGTVYDATIKGGTGSASEVSFPITSTTVAAFGFTKSGASNVWAGYQLSLSFSASSTAGSPGALTYNQFGPYLSSLTLGGGSVISGAPYSLIIPNSSGVVGGIGTIDNFGAPRTLISYSGTTLTIGDAAAEAAAGPTSVVITGPVSLTTKAFSTTTGSITSTTGKIGTTGGGAIQVTGGTLPTVTGGCGSGNVNAGSTNNRGSVTTGTAETTCSVVFSASGVWAQAPFCLCGDGGGDAAPLGCSVSAQTTSGVTLTFAAATAKTFNYICM
jgi:hypothetical protein